MTLDRFNQLAERVEMQKEMKAAAQEIVKDGSREIFAEYGDIVHSFGWTQYTPYFNDGDPCEFGMNELSIIAVEDLPTEAELESEGYGDIDELAGEEDWWYGGSPAFSSYGKSYAEIYDRYDDQQRKAVYKPNPNADERYVAARKAAEAVYNAVSYDDLSKDIFGDHVRVIFTKNGVEVEEYDHD